MDEIWRRFVNIVGNHRSGEAPRRSLGRVLLSGHSFEGRAASCTKRVLVDGWWMILTLEKGFIWVLYGFYWCFMMSFDFLWCLMIFYDVLYFFMMSYDFLMMFYGGFTMTTWWMLIGDLFGDYTHQYFMGNIRICERGIPFYKQSVFQGTRFWGFEHFSLEKLWRRVVCTSIFCHQWR